MIDLDRRTFLAGLGAIGVTTALPSVEPAFAAEGPWRPPARFLQPTSKLIIPAGGNYLRSGWCGTRVSLVQLKLGMGSRFEIYDAATISKVRSFQSSHGLYVDGVVGPATWSKLNTGKAFTIDNWRPAIAVPYTATRTQRIEQMIAFAMASRGAPYTWGGAGPYSLGYDCSGLMLAAMSSAGLDPQPLTVIKHQSPGFVTTEALYNSKFEKVPLSKRQRGDMIFWRNSSTGKTVHVAMYLGNSQIIEASSSSGYTKVSPWRGGTSTRPQDPYAVRIFTALTV